MLATIDDLNAIGAIPANQTGSISSRAIRLLELASAQVVTYAGYVDEATLVAALTSTQLTALAAVTAEAAGQRLNVTAAPSSDPYSNGGIPAWALLNRGHKRAIDDILGTEGVMTIQSTRDPDTSWLTLTGEPCE